MDETNFSIWRRFHYAWRSRCAYCCVSACAVLSVSVSERAVQPCLAAHTRPSAYAVTEADCDRECSLLYSPGLTAGPNDVYLTFCKFMCQKPWIPEADCNAQADEKYCPSYLEAYEDPNVCDSLCRITICPAGRRGCVYNTYLYSLLTTTTTTSTTTSTTVALPPDVCCTHLTLSGSKNPSIEGE